MDKSQSRKQFKELINHIISMNCDVDRKGVEACLKKSEPKGLDDNWDKRTIWDSLCKDALDYRYRMTISKAKKIVAEALFAQDIKYTKLKAKTVDFTDMARCDMIFVTVIGATTPDERLQAIGDIARKNGFRVQYDGATFVRG